MYIRIICVYVSMCVGTQLSVVELEHLLIRDIARLKIWLRANSVAAYAAKTLFR